MGKVGGFVLRKRRRRGRNRVRRVLGEGEVGI